MKTRISVPLVAALLSGCAGTPDCGDALAVAERAADDRAPVGAWIGKVDDSCRAAAEQGWMDALRTDCDPLFGFHAARRDLDRPGDCAGPAFEEAWSLGELLGGMEREQARIEARLAESDVPDAEARRLRQRLVVIGRDRPQVEALARMQGYLPPARVPDTPAQ